MAKKVLTTIKLQAPGGQASPAPPVGPALGQHGINIMEFVKAFGIDKGSGEPNRTKVGTITNEQVRAIAEKKLNDLNAHDVDQAAKIIAGTARSMGVEVVAS